jgi:hypothetical protein
MDVKKKKKTELVKGLLLLTSGAGVGWLIGLSASPVVHIVITSLIAFVVSLTSALAGIEVEHKEEEEGSKGKPKRLIGVDVNPFPMMIMILGLVAGASLGVYARANDWLGVKPANFVNQWKNTGLSDQDIIRRLFDNLYPPRSQNSEHVESVNQNQNVSTANQDTAVFMQNQNLQNNNNGRDHTERADSSGNSGAEKHKDKVSIQEGNTNENTGRSSAATSSLGVLFNATTNECATFRTARYEKLQSLLTNYRHIPTEERAKSCRDEKCLREIVRDICPSKKTN